MHANLICGYKPIDVSNLFTQQLKKKMDVCVYFHIGCFGIVLKLQAAKLRLNGLISDSFLFLQVLSDFCMSYFFVSSNAFGIHNLIIM